MSQTPEPTYSLSSLCASSICGDAVTESEKLECLRINKDKICRCCGGCNFSYKDVKFSCSEKEILDDDNNLVGVTNPPSSTDNTCWNKVCGTEDDKDACLKSKKSIICNCCKDSGTSCIFESQGKMYDACLGTIVSGTPNVTTKPKMNSISASATSTQTTDASSTPTWVWVVIIIFVLLLLGGGFYYYSKHYSNSTSKSSTSGVGKVQEIKSIYN